jgi:DNA polymerase III alpha subunit
MWENIENFAAYGFNKSHAVAYTYISSRLLALKAHYPLEFFAAILSCEETDNKIKEYKLDASKFGIEVCPIDINKSGVRFGIVDDKVYTGFANIKGIGDEPATRIVSGQPYDSFEDFLSKFGTDASVLKPLVSLGLFCDLEDRVEYWEFAEYYKDQMKKRESRDKRNAKSRQKYVEEFMYLIPDGFPDKYDYEVNESFLNASVEADRDDKAFAACLEGPDGQQQIPGIDIKEACKVYKKYKRCVQNHEKKVKEDAPITMDDFHPHGKVDDKMRDVLEADVLKAEKEFYGFSWNPLLERSPEYDNDWTFAEFDKAHDLRDTITRLVHCHVVTQPKEKKSRNNHSYYTMTVEDGEGRQEGVTVWGEDYSRFKDELSYWEDDVRMGNLLALRLDRPVYPFKNYTFSSPPKALRHKEVPKEKADDARCQVLTRPDPPEVKQYKPVEVIEL